MGHTSIVTGCSQLTSSDALTTSEGPLLVKLSWDGRDLNGKGNIAFSFSFCGVIGLHNSRVHCQLFALADSKENAKDISVMFVEMGFEWAWHSLKQCRRLTCVLHRAEAVHRLDVFCLLPWCPAPLNTSAH